MKKLLFLLFILINSLYAQPKPYIVMVSIDAFRWDYINREITPNLSQIKKEGASAISLLSAFPSKTFPNHTSIITGMYTENHGIISNDFEDLVTGEKYRMSDTIAVRQSKWYLGEPFWETAKRNGIIAASYYWPGSELTLAERRPDYFKQYQKNTADKDKIETFANWLKLPYAKRPHFITLYFEQVDAKSHSFGPDSPETNEAIKEVDAIVKDIKENIAKAGLRDSVNLIILSDHGMTGISNDRSINIEKMINNSSVKLINTGALTMIHPPKGKEKSIYNLLKKNEDHYKVYYKEEVPSYFHYSKNPFIPELVVIADLGWKIVDSRMSQRSGYEKVKKGDHGYDNYQLDMQGFFVAEGPAFKKHYYTGTLQNIDIYPLLCKIFGIQPRSNIDGKLERIEFILNGK